MRPGSCLVIGLAALGEVPGDAPVILVDPLDEARAAQRLQPADVRADECLGIAAGALHRGSGARQVMRWPIDAALAGDLLDVEVGGSGPRWAGAG